MKAKLRVLCVDDEPGVLEGLELHLRKRFRVVTATSGAEGLARLAEHDDFAVVLSDMRMPKMNGATFLSRARDRAPDATRMLLTGQTDLESAMAAVNEGHIFRFLTKPCPPPRLMANFQAAVEQHRLVHAERDLLEGTLRGSIKALTDVLALTHPLAFGRATRLQPLVTQMAGSLALEPRWSVEVASMLSQLGVVSLPSDTAERLYYGRELTGADEELVKAMPNIVRELLGSIPRLEPVLSILGAGPPGEAIDEATTSAREVLRVATAFDVLVSRGAAEADAVETLRGRGSRYDEAVVAALAEAQGHEEEVREIREIPLREIREGMTFADDVTTSSGMLLIARGHEVTPSFVRRAKGFRRGYVQEPIRVYLPKDNRRAA